MMRFAVDSYSTQIKRRRLLGRARYNAEFIDLLLAALLACTCRADTIVSIDTTQDGGTFDVSAPTLVITHFENEPLFTLTDGAITSPIEAVIVGNANGDVGRIRIEGESSLATVGDGLVGVYGDQSVFGGSSFLGLNSGSHGTATITGAGSIWDNPRWMAVGVSGTGNLTIEDGGAATSYFGQIGWNSGSDGGVTITGEGSTWTNDSELIVGNQGSGSLVIDLGGRLDSKRSDIGYGASGFGEAIVTGTGSTWHNTDRLIVGTFGTGVMTVENGGTLVSESHVGIGSESGGIGELIVNGAKSTWLNNGTLSVGGAGAGKISIENGGQVVGTVSGIHMGEVVVDGTDSSWLNSGRVTISSFGKLNIYSGATAGHSFASIGAAMGDAEVIVSGTGSTWDIAFNLGVGSSVTGSSSATGKLRIEDGGRVTDTNGYIGSELGSVGEVTVTGVGSTWINEGNFHVGFSGDAKLKIEAGGAVFDDFGEIARGSTSHGEVMVTGTGSKWSTFGLYVGGFGMGKLTVEDSGSVNNTTGIIAREVGAVGEASVSGLGSVWSNSNWLYAGFLGEGTLSIDDGGLVNSLHGLVGFESEGIGHVNIRDDGSAWANSGNLYVGYYGSGHLAIENGALASNLQGAIGTFPNSSGSVTVRGPGSSWVNTETLFIGVSGTGELTIESGGQVISAAGAVGDDEGGSGVVTVLGSGSTWTIGGDLVIGRGLSASTGRLEVREGGRVSVDDFVAVYTNGTINLQPGGILEARTLASSGGDFHFTGGVLQVDVFQGDLVNWGGTIVTGSEDGTTNVDIGSYTQLSGGALRIGLDGVLSGQWDKLLVDGDATLGGTLDLRVAGDFEPAVGTIFPILETTGSVFGQFDVEQIPTFSGLTFDVSYGATRVVLEVIEAPAVPGDYDGNGSVGPEDYMEWAASFGSMSNLAADGNASGVIDAADYVVWRKNDGTQDGFNTWGAKFGQTAGGETASNAAVPEPATGILFVLGATVARRKALRTRLAHPNSRLA